jgi:hypothetical protein
MQSDLKLEFLFIYIFNNRIMRQSGFIRVNTL